MSFGPPILAIDTCGPSGSVALGRLAGRDLEILGQIELAARTYSATLVAAVAELLQSAGDRTPRARRDCCRQRAGELYRRPRRSERRKGPGRGRRRFRWSRSRASKCFRANPAYRRRRSMRIAARSFCGWSALDSKADRNSCRPHGTCRHSSCAASRGCVRRRQRQLCWLPHGRGRNW